MSCTQSASITAPAEVLIVGASSEFVAKAMVTDTETGPLDPLQVRWEDDNGVALGTSDVDTDGVSETTLMAATAIGELHARVLTTRGACDATTSTPVLVCQESISEDFNVPPNSAEWTLFGDAAWDAGGWLEMTGLAQGQQGAVYNGQTPLAAGDASLRFEIFTGGGVVTGADGLAMTVIDASDSSALGALVGAAANGGGMGYGVAGNYGSFVGDALTIEVDTYFNIYDGETDLHTDPTSQNHLEVTRGGDPGNSLAHAEIAGVEDQQWHQIEVDLVQDRVVVRYDGQVMIDVTEPGFQFSGGYIVFSGSTGFYVNYHRFDDLLILQDCN